MKPMAICAACGQHRFFQTAAFVSCTLILIDYMTASAVQEIASDTPDVEVAADASNCCTVTVGKSYRIG